jgi:glycerol-3-phosphate acyltransferase PlsY
VAGPLADFSEDDVFRDLVLLAAGYLLGSIPFGVVIARVASDVDLRRVGSGNIGATNVLRAVGKGAAALTLVGDIGKGALAVGLARWTGASAALVALVGLAAVLGHLFPVWAGFRGGKGVATTLGVILGAMPIVGGLLLAIWLAVAAITRYSSLAALAATVTMPLLAWLVDGRPAMIGLSGALLVLVVVRHRENIVRLLGGTEGKIGQKARQAASDGHSGRG